jgi:HK97 family phage major capsid protein
VSWLMSTIQNRLVFMLRRREEAQLLNGDGTAPNISGITDRSGLQTQAKGSDPTPDAILKAANLIRVNSFYEPDGVVIDPLDMQDIRLLRTADGIYIFGSPSDPYTAIRLWGMEVRETTAQTDNTAIVGAFGTAAQVFRRSGITVTASTEHASYFVENKVAILAEERLALAVYRPNAFCTVTGI